MLFMESESLEHTNHLSNAAANRQIVDELMPNHPFLIDDEEPAEGDPGLFIKDMISPGYFLFMSAMSG